MKYRIKITELNNGEKIYLPQVFYTQIYIGFLPLFILIYVGFFPLILLGSVLDMKWYVGMLWNIFFNRWEDIDDNYKTEKEALSCIEKHKKETTDREEAYLKKQAEKKAKTIKKRTYKRIKP